MKPVKLITWNEDTQRYEMSLGSLGIKRTIPPESTDEFKVFVAGSFYPTLCISNSSLSDSSIITVEADSDDDEATIIVNGVSHFNDVVNIKHRIDFLKGNDNDGYYTSSSLDADKVPNLAMFTIGTEHGSTKYTLGTVKSVLAQEEYLEIPCKSLFSEYVTFTNGLMLACDATSNGTVNFNGPANFRSAANFDTIRIGDQTLDENTIINILNGSYGSSSAIDVSRFVSTHAAGNATTGEEQSIYGGKTFKDETVFEDNVVLENGATVYQDRDITPSESDSSSLGNLSFRFKNVYTKTLNTDILTKSSTGSTDNYRISVEGDLTPGVMNFSTGVRKATFGTDGFRWDIYASTLSATTAGIDTLNSDTVTADSADMSSAAIRTLDIYDPAHQNHCTIKYSKSETSLGINGGLTVDCSIMPSSSVQGSGLVRNIDIGSTSYGMFRSVCTKYGNFSGYLCLPSSCRITDLSYDNSDVLEGIPRNSVAASSMAFINSASSCSLSVRTLGDDEEYTLDLRDISELTLSSDTLPRTQVPVGGLVQVMPSVEGLRYLYQTQSKSQFVPGEQIQISGYKATDPFVTAFVKPIGINTASSGGSGVYLKYLSNQTSTLYPLTPGTYRILCYFSFDSMSGYGDNILTTDIGTILLQRIA